jgi:hypothetical protein
MDHFYGWGPARMTARYPPITAAFCYAGPVQSGRCKHAECREVLERAIHSSPSGIAPDQMKEAGNDWQSLPLKFVVHLTS